MHSRLVTETLLGQIHVVAILLNLKPLQGFTTTPFMVFNDMRTICEGPKLYPYKSQSVTSANC